jgi:hypothetical protein
MPSAEIKKAADEKIV